MVKIYETIPLGDRGGPLRQLYLGLVNHRYAVLEMVNSFIQNNDLIEEQQKVNQAKILPQDGFPPPGNGDRESKSDETMPEVFFDTEESFTQQQPIVSGYHAATSSWRRGIIIKRKKIGAYDMQAVDRNGVKGGRFFATKVRDIPVEGEIEEIETC